MKLNILNVMRITSHKQSNTHTKTPKHDQVSSLLSVVAIIWLCCELLLPSERHPLRGWIFAFNHVVLKNPFMQGAFIITHLLLALFTQMTCHTKKQRYFWLILPFRNKNVMSTGLSVVTLGFMDAIKAVMVLFFGVAWKWQRWGC